MHSISFWLPRRQSTANAQMVTGCELTALLCGDLQWHFELFIFVILQADDLQKAAAILKEEIQAVHKQVGHDGTVDEEFMEAWTAALGEWIYLPSQKRYGRIASATNSDKVESLKVCSALNCRSLSRDSLAVPDPAVHRGLPPEDCVPSDRLYQQVEAPSAFLLRHPAIQRVLTCSTSMHPFFERCGGRPSEVRSWRAKSTSRCSAICNAKRSSRPASRTHSRDSR